METMPFYLVIIQSFPETLILIYLGLALTGLKADWKRIMLVAFLTALASYLIRTSALPAGMNIIIQLPILVLLLSILGRLSFSKATVACVLGLILLSFFEIIFNALMTAVTGVSVWQVTDEPWLRIIFPIPEFISLTLIAVLINKYRGRLIAWHKERYTHLSPMIWKGEVGLLLLFIIGMIAFGFYYETNLSQFQHPYAMFMSNTMYFIIFSVITLSLLLVQKLVFVQKQSRLMQAQRLHIDNLQEMMQVIKGQRHDFINHIQVVYGLLNLDEIDKARNYISKLYKDVQVSGDILHLGIPELSALLLVKTGAATGKGITLRIDIETSLASLRISSLDLVAVVGNLINNALEAVENMEADREVTLRILTESGFYVIQVHNSGSIPADIHTRLFEPGFSTKGSDERGIGLASVKYLVEKYHGKVVVDSDPNRGTCFTVYYPKLRERRHA